MARRTEEFKVEAVGRDKGKIFLLTEMSAFAAEKWAAKALLALMKSGVDVPDDIANSGTAGLASIAMAAFGGVPPESLIALLDEMMSCVQCIPDPRNPLSVRKLVEEDIEELVTLFEIRKRLLDLHLGFSLAAKLSKSPASAAVEPTSPIMSMSQA